MVKIPQIYDAERLSIIHRFQIDCEIELVLWSPDDAFIMCVNKRRSIIHLRTLKNSVIEMNLDGWSGTITEEMMAGVCWSADSRSIITFTDL